MKSFIVSIFIFSVFHLTAQHRADVRYFDEAWNPVLRKEQASYYRQIKDADSVYRVTDFYRNDSLFMDGYFSSISPLLVHQGKATWYYESGRIKKEGYFKNGKPVGVHREFFENGGLRSETLYDPTTEFHLSRYDESGNSLLKDGYGVYTTRYMNYDYYNEVFDSQLQRSYYIDERRDTIYGTATKPAEYSRGMKQFYKNLRDVQYPYSQRNGEKDGTVLVSFVIDAKGKMRNVQVVKGLGPDFDPIALRVVRRNSDWKPAQFEGRPVPMRFVVPVVFLHDFRNGGYAPGNYRPYYGPTFYNF